MGRLFIFIILILTIAANCSRRSALLSPEETMEITDSLKGISGLTYWNDQLWAHNDKDDRTLYVLDPSDGSILEFFELEANRWPRNEWEDIAQDDDHLYIGDMGNNERGNRRDLHILRIEKKAIRRGELIVDTISYSYSDQVHFNRVLPNTTRYDCEAMLVTGDSIYLFTKQWIAGKTSVYSLPKSPGSHKAILLSTHHVGGMITGATCHEDSNVVVLCGYTFFMQPFLLVLSDFGGNDFFSGSRLKIRLDLPFHQVEGITTDNGTRYYFSNERSYLPKIHKSQKIHSINLERYMD